EVAIAGTGVPCLRAENMDDAVHMAFAQSTAGDTVLLSPACSSFDMFKNYKHRGEVFATAVTSLARTATNAQGHIDA
ncbi:MAG: UDP-N-acetylmuramoyl-L-alanine--D-glutamate ligase, partial [Aeromicrobium sp.]|nr:UDP-N-acetylmuramoyl-L-alanine--D-glutamate ligase [Burkholderiales bacterium]